MKEKIFILGSSGLLGRNLCHYLKNYYQVIGHINERLVYLDGIKKVSFNLFNKKDLDNFLIKHRPNIIINSTGITNVEECEKDKPKAFKVNVKINDLFSSLSKQYNFKFISISTDHLHKQNNRKKFSEKDITNPINYYAYTKIKSEKLILQNSDKSLILRTNFFGDGFHYRKSFSDQIIEKLIHSEKVFLFKDVFFNPVSISNFAYILKKLIKKNISGIINVSSDEKISKYKFGLLIAKKLNLNSKLITPITLSSKKKLKKRPKNMALDNSVLKKILNVKKISLISQIKKLKHQKKINKLIPYGRQSINKNDIKSVNKVLKSDFITQGPKIDEFEKKVSNYVGSKYAVAVSSASAGLHLSCLAYNLNKKSNLITSPITFVSTANAGKHCGSKIFFSDIDLNTINLDPISLENKLKNNKEKNLVIPVHFAGLGCDMKNINKLRNKYNFDVVEDASHALGAKYPSGEKIGCCKYSLATVFSFHPVKIIASGEGGIITTNNKDFYEKLISLRSHGMIRENKKFFNEDLKKSPFAYEIHDLGLNYRITDIQSALAISQLNRINRFIFRRRKIAKIYDKYFSKIPYIELPQKKFRDISSNHLYIIMLNFKKLGISRESLMENLKKNNIGTQVHYIPIPKQPIYYENNYQNRYKNSYKYYNSCLSIPIHNELKYKDQLEIIKKIIYYTN